MVSRVARRRHRRTPCLLCLEPIAGFRMELGATWVAHSTCFDAATDKLRRVLLLDQLDADTAREAVRRHLTRLAVRLYARPPRQANPRRGGRT